jgi:hypothetical protein
MKRMFVWIAAMMVIAMPQTVPAQSQLAANAATAVKITEARKANAALMRQYTWESRTELIEAGQVKDTRLDQVGYGPDGQLQRTLLNDQSSRLPIGFLRRAIIEDKRKQMEEYLTALRGLLDQYTLPTTGKVLDFMNQAVTTGPDAGGLILMSGSSVIVSGDNMSVWTDARSRQTRKVQVNTFYQGDAVELTATFKTLRSGLTYAAYAEVTVPAKQLSVQVQNYDYNRTMAPPSPQATKQKPSAPAAGASAPAPAAPPVTNTQAAAMAKLKELKSLQKQGLISEAQYQAESQKILNQLVE